MSRSAWKPKFIDKSVLRFYYKKLKVFIFRKFYFRCRRSNFHPSFLNCRVGVYTGKNFFPFKVRSNYIGRKLGEFSFSKKRGQVIHIFNKTQRKRAKALLLALFAKKKAEGKARLKKVKK